MNVKYVWEDCLFNYNNTDHLCTAVVLVSEVGKALAEKDKAYQQLMEQAVEFAKCLTGCPSPCTEADWPECRMRRAGAFLKEREDRWAHRMADLERGCDVSAGSFPSIWEKKEREHGQ